MLQELKRLISDIIVLQGQPFDKKGNIIAAQVLGGFWQRMYCTPLSRHEFKKAKLCSFLHVLTRDNKLSPVFEVGLRRALAANA